MKSILMSIQPYYAYLEMKGIKTVEMRKTLPKDKEWSGKVKVYVSQNKKSFNRIPKEDRVWFKQYVGKVAYEFVCDYVEKEAVAFTEMGNLGRLYHCRLSLAELKKYAGKRTSLYYWHISALKVYDKPKELWEFRKVYKKDCEGFIKCDRNPCNYVDKETGKYIYHDCVKECPHLAEKYKVTHAPQSYMRIEEVEE